MPPKPPPFVARSLLFVPGDRPERFSKAIASGAHAICIDLEDAVEPARKAMARQEAMAFLGARPADVGVCVRINGLRTPAGLRDLLALAETDGAAADAVLLPKAESAAELRLASEVCSGRQRWIPLVESAAGLRAITSMATEAADLAALMFGGADFSVDLGCAFEWEALLAARHRIVHAAALARVPAIDVPFLDPADADGLVAETRRSAALGFACKAVIHPAQVAAVQAALLPSDAELARARRIVDAADRSQGGVLTVDGRMVDAPVIAAARRTLDRGFRT